MEPARYGSPASPSAGTEPRVAFEIQIQFARRTSLLGVEQPSGVTRSSLGDVPRLAQPGYLSTGRQGIVVISRVSAPCLSYFPPRYFTMIRHVSIFIRRIAKLVRIYVSIYLELPRGLVVTLLLIEQKVTKMRV